MATGLSSISGLASGLDTESIISQLVAIKQVPINRITNQITVQDAKKTGLQEVSNLVTALRSAATSLRDESLWATSQTIESTDEKIAKVSGTAAASGGYQINVKSLARAAQMVSQPTTSLPLTAGTLTIGLGQEATVDVEVTDSDTLDDVAKKINANSKAGAFASVIDGALYLNGKKTGADNDVVVTGDASAQFGFTQRQAGSNMTYSIDGSADQTSASNTLKGAIPGLTIDARAIGTTSINVGESKVDGEKVAAKMQAFVDAYNQAMKGSKERAGQQKVKDAATNADLIKGALYNDSSLGAVITNLYDFRYRKTDGVTNGLDSFQALGIDIPSVGSKDTTGALTFDKAKFLAKFNEDPEAVRAALDNTTANKGTEGLTQFVDRSLDLLTSSSGVLKAGLDGATATSKQMTATKTTMTERLTRYQEAQKALWSRLETALSKIQSQGSGISGQLAALTANS